MRRSALGPRSGRTKGMTRLYRALVLVFLLASVSAGTALACPVCFDRDDESRVAFLATTGLLTLLPLGMVAGAGTWFWRRFRSRGPAGRKGAGPDGPDLQEHNLPGR